MVRLRSVLQHGVSLAGDCIFNEALLSLCPGLWYDYAGSYTVVSLAGDCIFNEALLSLCPGLWYDYAGSYTMVFPVLGAPLLVGGALLFLLPCVAPVSLHH